MAFKDYEEFADDALELPIRGKTYKLPDVSAKLGHMLRLEKAGKETKLRSLPVDEERDLYLGKDVHRQMVADGVPDKVIGRAVLVVLTYWQAVTSPGHSDKSARETAEAVWEAGIDPESLAAKLAAKAQESTESTSTGEATTTPEPASTSGMSTPTTTRPASRKRKAPAKKAASPGSTSPSSGH